MRAARRFRFWAAAVGACICACVFVATLVRPQWFELLFDEAPDGGDGSLEAALALVCCVVLGVLLAALAGRERRRAKSESA